MRIKKVLDKFYSLCRSGKIVATFEDGDTTYSPSWDEYYQKTFEPILGEFSSYYIRSKDTGALSKLLRINKCDPDGGFAEAFDFALATCYEADKKVFIRLVKTMKKDDKHESFDGRVLTGIQYFYAEEYEKHKILDTEILPLIEKERQRIRKQFK